jgi:hypothetical protein
MVSSSPEALTSLAWTAIAQYMIRQNLPPQTTEPKLVAGLQANSYYPPIGLKRFKALEEAPQVLGYVIREGRPGDLGEECWLHQKGTLDQLPVRERINHRQDALLLVSIP